MEFLLSFNFLLSSFDTTKRCVILKLVIPFLFPLSSHAQKLALKHCNYELHMIPIHQMQQTRVLFTWNISANTMSQLSQPLHTNSPLLFVVHKW